MRPVLARPAEALSGYYGTHWGTHGAHTYPPSELKEALDAAHGWIPASLIGLESGCEGMPGVLWVLYCPLGVLMGLRPTYNTSCADQRSAALGLFAPS